MIDKICTSVVNMRTDEISIKANKANSGKLQNNWVLSSSILVASVVYPDSPSPSQKIAINWYECNTYEIELQDQRISTNSPTCVLLRWGAPRRAVSPPCDGEGNVVSWDEWPQDEPEAWG